MNLRPTALPTCENPSQSPLAHSIQFTRNPRNIGTHRHSMIINLLRRSGSLRNCRTSCIDNPQVRKPSSTKTQLTKRTSTRIKSYLFRRLSRIVQFRRHRLVLPQHHHVKSFHPVSSATAHQSTQRSLQTSNTSSLLSTTSSPRYNRSRCARPSDQASSPPLYTTSRYPRRETIFTPTLRVRSEGGCSQTEIEVD